MNLKKYVKIREEKFGGVLFDTLREKVFVTNKTGKDILQLVNENKNQEEIVGILKEKYNEESSIIEKDIISFIDGLKKDGILI